METKQRTIVIGSGQVGLTLAQGLANLGHEVTIASREGKAVAGWEGQVGRWSEAVGTARLVVLAVKGTAAEDVVRGIADQIAGKTVIDVTNPIADAPPVNNVLRFFTSLDESLLERLQRLAPQAHFVKAFSSVGAPNMVHPSYGGLRPSMFICGNDTGAKAEVTAVLDAFGWDIEDMGGVEAARAIEPLCMLWCIPGFQRNEWTHAFRLLHR